MAGSDVLDFERVLERRHRLCDDVVWGDDEMEAADDQTNFRIDGHRRLDDPFDSRVRAADHEHHAVRGINRKNAAEYFQRFPKERYQTEVESWRHLQSQNIEFTMKRLREPIESDDRDMKEAAN